MNTEKTLSTHVAHKIVGSENVILVDSPTIYSPITDLKKIIAELPTSKAITLTFNSNNMGDADNMGDAEIKDIADALKVNSTLQVLTITNTNMGYLGAQYLADALKVNSTLQVLIIISNNIGNVGAQCLADALKVNSTLHSLILDKTKIGNEGAQYLADALKVNSTLEVLILDNNDIGNTGVSDMAKALKVNSTLHTLSLNNNHKIGYKGIQEMIVTLKGNYTLKILNLNNYDSDGNIIISDSDANMITPLIWKLDKYLLENATPLYKLISAVKKGNIAILENTIFDNVLDQTDRNGKTPLMWAGKTKQTEVAEMLIEKGASIRDFLLETKDEIGRTILMWAAQKGHTETVVKLIKARASLECMDDYGWDAMYLAIHYKYKPVIKAIELELTLREQQNKQKLEQEKTLGSKITISTDQNPQDLSNLHTEYKIVGSKNVIVSDSPNIYSPITDLKKIIAELPTSQAILFEFNNIGDAEVKDNNEVKNIANALKVNSTLQVLIMTNNNIGNEGAKYLAEALKVNSTLQVLILFGNNIGDEGAKYLAEALKVNTTLEILSLGNNNVSPALVKKMEGDLGSTLSVLVLGTYDSDGKEISQIDEQRDSSGDIFIQSGAQEDDAQIDVSGNSDEIPDQYD